MDLATVDHLLTTTRSVRQRLDLTRPVDPAVIAQCLDVAIQAPTATNTAWNHFVVVTDPTKRAGLATLYRRAFTAYWTPEQRAHAQQTDPRNFAAYQYLADHLHDVPVHIIPCVENFPETAGAYWQAT